MSLTLLLVQVLNGLQFGVILFLVAAGLTLVFGVMDFLNLAHGVQYMLGAYLTTIFAAQVHHFGLGLLLGLAGALTLGFVLEVLLFRPLAHRTHLEQVLGTFGVILCVTELVKMIFGAAPISFPVPSALSGSVTVMPGLLYPVWRLAIIGSGLLVALLLYLLVSHTRFGMLVRAASTHRHIVSALGVDTDRLFLIVFSFGAMLAGFAGAMAGPLLAVEPNMGDTVLILAFVVVVIGGVGSIKGALIASLLVGVVDTLGRSFATDALKLFVSKASAAAAGPAIASMAIYVLMVFVLFFRPSGLFSSPR
ncbi:MAG TPA: branched-chain amino acid ABC transporter permease [Hyphomicrobiales bacterium]|nr:branched-chain amino acid ABC transporter permease [Hyphomicrobiales bacterium]